MNTSDPRVIGFEKAVVAMTTEICGKPGYPVTWGNCERIARDVMRRAWRNK